MNKYYILSLMLLALIIPGVTNAQVKTTTSTTAVVEPAGIPEQLKNEPLSVKKAYVEGQLKSLLAQLNTIYGRTQLAVDRLTQNGVNTVSSQEELDKAALALNEARLNIDSFIAISIANESDKQTAAALSLTLKESVMEAEKALTFARDSLLKSLGLLKASLNVSLTDQTQ